MADSCKQITGIDVEKSAIDHAKEKYQLANCSFLNYDGKKIPYPDNNFDIIISFQVIEHVSDDNGFIREINRVLKSGGWAFITTPNKTYRLKPGQKPWNRYHIREYYPQELAVVLQKVFTKAEVRGVFGNEEITRAEFNRVKTGLLLSLVARLQIRRLIPESWDYILAKLIRTLKGKKVVSPADSDFHKAYQLNDFEVKSDNVDNSLDLMGICNKD